MFTLVAAVEEWPRILPHYRWVRRVRGDDAHRELDMGARRGVIPVRWRARVEPLPAQRLLRFYHTGGPTRGMEVEWRFLPQGEGTTVELWHRFHSPLPLIAPVYEWVAQHIFIEHIAGKTLRHMRHEAERQAAHKRTGEVRA